MVGELTVVRYPYVPMKILYTNVIEMNAGWGAEVFVDAALREQGHTTLCIDFKKHHRDLAHQFMKVKDFEVLLLQRGDGISIPVLEAVQRPRFFWASELVSRCRDQDRLFQWGGFDYLWVRGYACRETLIERGWVKPDQCGILQSGFDPMVHRPSPEVVRDIDVLFVGSLTSRRCEILERLSTRWNVRVEKVFGSPMVNLLHRAKIVLNIHAEDYKDVETRIYEVLGSGAFLLSEPLAVENPFASEDILIWDNEEELNEKIAYFLKHEDERETIRQRAHNAAWNGHTWGHRATQIVNDIQPYIPSGQRGESLNRRLLGKEVAKETPFLLAQKIKRAIFNRGSR